ncbi:DoxX family membrane protein [Flavobacterium sp. T12S277]|uniref:DoxX family membrane protein n=1 Tax=Flavobacterium sp. T12S277 TaxID=3402752 RepID=UPI003AD97146
MKLIILILRFVAVIILLQTLYFKFSGAKESIYIFSALGIEPYGRIGSGVIELVAAVLILIPKTTWLGALIGLGVMIGALLSHFFFTRNSCAR